MKDRLEDIHERLKLAKVNWTDVGSRELLYYLTVLVEEVRSLRRRIDRMEPRPLSEGLERLQEKIDKGGT